MYCFSGFIYYLEILAIAVSQSLSLFCFSFVKISKKPWKCRSQLVVSFAAGVTSWQPLYLPCMVADSSLMPHEMEIETNCSLFANFGKKCLWMINYLCVLCAQYYSALPFESRFDATDRWHMTLLMCWKSWPFGVWCWPQWRSILGIFMGIEFYILERFMEAHLCQEKTYCKIYGWLRWILKFQLLARL